MKLQVLGGTSSQRLIEKINPILSDPDKYLLKTCLDEEILKNKTYGSSLFKFKPSSLQINTFPDGELNVKIDRNIRGDDIFIIQSTSPPVNENLVELLLIIDAAKRASAGRITVVLPYFGYSRKDRKDEGRVPISAKLIANLLTTAGADRILTLDLHAEQIQGFFDIPVDHLYSFPVLKQHIKKSLNDDNLIFVGPDLGATKLARKYAHVFKSDIALIDKRRINGEDTSIQSLIGDVFGKNVVLVDDIISTAGSISNAAHFLKTRGAQKIYMVATHGLFCGSALEKLMECPYEKIFITDSVSNGVFSNPEMREQFRVEVVSVAKLIAIAIQHIHLNDSVSKLINYDQDDFLLI